MKSKLATRTCGMMACAALALALALGLAAPAARADAPDTSTPKSTGLAFARAIQSGDMATARLVATGTELDWKLMKLLSDWVVAAKSASDAGVAKFGPEGRLPNGIYKDFVADFETMTEKIEGDKATLISPSRPTDKNPPIFKKTATGWMMDLTNLDTDPDTAMMLQMLPEMARAFNTIAANIKAGKYASIDEAVTDYEKAMTAAEKSATPPAPAPAPAP